MGEDKDISLSIYILSIHDRYQAGCGAVFVGNVVFVVVAVVVSGGVVFVVAAVVVGSGVLFVGGGSLVFITVINPVVVIVEAMRCS